MEFKVSCVSGCMLNYLKELKYYDLKVRDISDDGKICDYSTFYIEIHSIEDLMDIQKNVGKRLIIDKGEITIYDGYIE